MTSTTHLDSPAAGAATATIWRRLRHATGVIAVSTLLAACGGSDDAAGDPDADADAPPPPVLTSNRWVGTTTYVIKTPGLPAENITATANITWTPVPAESSVGNIVYQGKGAFTLAFNHADGCISTVSPNTFDIADTPAPPVPPGVPLPPLPPVASARLALQEYVAPPVYSFGAAQRVDTTLTTSCPGRTPGEPVQMRGFEVSYGYGTGPWTGQATLAGSTDDGAIASSWSFSRP